jgi:hypothetical protein
MRHALAALMFVAAASLLSGSALAQKIDVNGRCHDASGKFAKMEVCKPADKTADAPAKCRDKATKKFAKCDAPNTEPVPAKAK